MPSYLPDRGDLIWLNFTPQAGKEQAGRRPALLLSPSSYNRKSGLALVCPVTSQVKGYPFEVAIPAGLPVQGVILCDHLRSLDWQERRATRINRLPDSVMAEVLARIGALIGLDGD